MAKRRKKNIKESVSFSFDELESITSHDDNLTIRQFFEMLEKEEIPEMCVVTTRFEVYDDEDNDEK